MVARILIVNLLLGLLLSSAVYASPKIEHWQTSNGGRVYFAAAPELAMLDIQVVFDAGSARDGEQSGMALLTNAMLNEGAAGLNTDQIATAFEDVGAQFSNSSQRDMAVLNLRSLTADFALPAALKMFSNVLTQADFPVASFERIKKQMLLGLQAEKQSPAALSSRTFYSHVYDKHVYAAMPAGEEDSVSQLTIDSIRNFYQRYYVAKNAVVVLVGAIDKAQAKLIAEQLLSGLPVGDRAEALDKVPALIKGAIIKREHPSTQTHIMMGQVGMSRHDPDYFSLYVGNHILGGSGLVSRLSNEVREKRGLSYSVYSYFRPMRVQGPYQFGLQTRNDQAGEALDVMKATLKEFTDNGPTKEELIAAKQNITGGFALRVDSNRKIAGYLAMIGFYGLPLEYLENFKDKVNAVTVEAIKDAYIRRVDVDKMITVMVGGKAE